jgi:hypothetical protein
MLGINMTLLIGQPVLPLPFPLPDDSIKSVEVTNTDEGRDGFQLTFFVGRSTPADILDYPLIGDQVLKPFNRVIIMLTISGIPEVLIDGIITHVQLNQSDTPGQSTLTVTGEDVGVLMDMEEKSETFPNQSDSTIVTRIISSYTKFGIIPVVIPTTPSAMNVSAITELLPSQHGTDLSYIQELARYHGYVFYIEPRAPGFSNAYWGPPKLSGVPQKALSINIGPETNVSSISFQYNALAPNLVDGTVQDRTTNIISSIKRTSSSSSARPFLSSEPALIANKPNLRIKKFRESGLNTSDAEARAQTETDRSQDVLVANGEIDSLRYGGMLRARKLVGLRGAGYAHDGLYYVKRVTHLIGIGEYRQTFTLVREGYGSITPVVVP